MIIIININIYYSVIMYKEENTSTPFRNLVSTSNNLEDDIITIETDSSSIIWIMEFNH